jgi:capsular polysaccharide biosynthesis protein
MLFHNAEIIIAPQGTSAANILFCTPKTQIFELFQGLNDCTFWYISQILNLNYTPIATTDFVNNYYQAWQSDTYMSPSIIQTIIPHFT